MGVGAFSGFLFFETLLAVNYWYTVLPGLGACVPDSRLSN